MGTTAYEKMTALADAIRSKTGETGKLSIDAMTVAVDNISAGAELPELTEPATEDEVFLNQEYIDANGEKRSGTFTIDEEIYTQDELITQIQNAVNNLPDANSGGSNGIFNLRIFSEDSIYDILTIYYMSNGQACSWEFEGIPVNEIVIENIDVNSFFIIDAGAFHGYQNLMIEDISTNLVNVYDGIIFYGTQSDIVATIQLQS